MDNHNPIKTSIQNGITNKMIKTLNKFKSSRAIKDTILNNHLKNFHTDIIKLKIRKNRQFKSLFDNIDISSPSDNFCQSPQLNKMQKQLINLKLKSKKNKLFNNIILNNMNSINNKFNNIGNKIKPNIINYEKAASFHMIKIMNI